MLKSVIAVCVGASLGALLRWWLGSQLNSLFPAIPPGTLAANLVGGYLADIDLRRTFAKLAHNGKSPIEQIQLSLGHSSVQTTERYIGFKQDLHSAPCDALGLVL